MPATGKPRFFPGRASDGVSGRAIVTRRGTPGLLAHAFVLAGGADTRSR
jgi:hypothetical protein